MKGKWLIASGLLVAELALCAIIVGVLWGSMGQMRWTNFRFGGFSADVVSAKADEEQRFTVDGPAILNVNRSDQLEFGLIPPSYGNVTVVGGPGNEIVVTAHKTAWGANDAAAQADLANLKVVVTQNKNKIQVRVDQPEQVVTFGDSRPDTVDFVITVPVETSVTLGTSFGDLSISGTQGDLNLDTNSGKVSVKQIKGGNVQLRSDFGDLTLNDVNAGTLDADTNSGKVTLSNVQVTGLVTLKSDFGAINFDEGSADSLAAKTNSGEVALSSLKVEKSATIKSDFGQVTLTGVAAGSYDLRSNSGNVTLAGASGSVVAHTDFGNVTVNKAQAVTIDLSTNSGNVDFAGTLGQGPHLVKTDFGHIVLQLPKTAALTLDLKTDFGRIKSDILIMRTGDQENEHWQGDINGGGADLTAKTNSGDITIEILEP